MITNAPVFSRRTALLGLASCGVCSALQSFGDDQTGQAKPHPLDPALKLAREKLDFMRRNVRDYTCTIVKRERIKGELQDHQFMAAKIRNRKEVDGRLETPFGVYLNFLQPASLAGREVIWVEGQNGGNLVAHEPGLLNIKRASLPPTGFLAMMGQRYPITEIGAEQLLVQLISKGDRDRAHGECEVKFVDGTTVNKRRCLMIQVVHPERRAHFDFHKAQIFLDREWDVPVRYAAWSWPESTGGEPVLEEEYTYIDLKINVGLTDKDFDPNNADYNYPRF